MSQHVSAHGQASRRSSGSPSGRAVSSSSQTGGSTGLDAILLKVVDAGFMGVLFLAPYFMGGRHPVGRFVFVAFAVLIAVAWLARQCVVAQRRWIHSPAEWILAGAVTLCVLQLVTLPDGVVAGVSPAVAEILPSGSNGSALSLLFPWERLSLAPAATLDGLVMLLAYGLLFVVAVQRIESLHDVKLFLRWIAGSAVLMAAVGLLQYLAGNGKFMWVYEHPFRTPKGNVLGSFINRNHFAQFLALGLGPLIWWTASTMNRLSTMAGSRFGAKGGKRTESPLLLGLLVVALGCVMFAGLMSLSRGGAVAFGVAIVAGGFYFAKSGLLRVRHLAWGIGIAALLVGSLFIHGQERVGNRLDDVSLTSFDELDSRQLRRMIWGVNVEAFQAFPWLGTGVGSHREICPMFLTDWFGVEFTHAESGYLQVASETGVLGLLLLGAFLLLVGSWAIRTFFEDDDHHGTSGGSGRTSTTALAGAVVAGLAASAVHSVFDFVWYIPACFAVTILLVACLLRIHQLSHYGEAWSSRLRMTNQWAAVASVGVVILLGVWMLRTSASPALASAHWDSYQRTSSASRQNGQRQSLDVATYRDEAVIAQTETMILSLQNVLRCDPTNARAHVRLAGLYLRQFEQKQLESENAIGLSQIADAALRSEFKSREELYGWLDRAVGPNLQNLNLATWHIRRGLAICPMQGEGYLYLADLCFLFGGDRQAKSEFIAQALRVRPHSESVLFAAGKDAMIEGDLETATRYWRECYHQGGRYKGQLVDLLSRQIAVSFFLQVFEPKFADWEVLLERYQQASQSEELQQFREYFERLAQARIEETEPLDRGRLWFTLRSFYLALELPEEALVCSQRAFDTRPNDPRVRRALGEDLLHAEQFAEAAEHLKWSFQRRPHDVVLKRLLETATIGRVRNAGRHLDNAKKLQGKG